MISAKFVCDLLKNQDVDLFCGVPDSLLKDFCAYVTDNVPKNKNIITANEGNAIALAAGHYLATKKTALVYMQNSGIGNAINPLLSLTDEEVYNIPLIIFVGWRGEPNKPDEPQHVKQGKVTGEIFDVCKIEHSVLPQDEKSAEMAINKAFEHIRATLKPYVFIISKGTFEKYEKKKISKKFEMTREEAICKVAEFIDKKDKNSVIISTTGQISRELYEHRERSKQPHNKDFLTVGSMGQASSIALGIALEKPQKTVYCFDGDGAILMQMGAMPVIAQQSPKNFKHILFNNEAHDSVGGQKTSADTVNFKELATACGYKNAYSVERTEDLEKTLDDFIKSEAPTLLEIKVQCGARADLGRPKEKPVQNKIAFMEKLNAD